MIISHFVKSLILAACNSINKHLITFLMIRDWSISIGGGGGGSEHLGNQWLQDSSYDEDIK